MPETSLTINHADGGSETYTINRDKFEGVRNMTVDGAAISVDRSAAPDESTFTVRGISRPDGARKQAFLYGICGQSNAAGRAENVDAGTRFDALDALDSKAFIYNRSSSSFDEFDFGVNQHFTGGTSTQFGPESELLRLAAIGTEEEIFVVSYAQGGSDLYQQWDSEAGGNLYADFVNDYQTAEVALVAQGYEVVHKGVLFAQGERDSRNDLGAGVLSYYEEKQLKFVNNLRKDLQVPNLPVSLTLTRVLGSLSSTYTHVAEVNQAKQNVANTLSNVSIIDSSSFSFKTDDLHYDGAGQISHGAAFHSQALGSFTVSSLTVDRDRGAQVRTLYIDGQAVTIDRSDEVLILSFIQEFGQPTLAYSLRDLNGDGRVVVKVRRSSDNLDRDFTATELTDGTLLAWVGAGNNGFVTVWYDQSGNNNHATQVIEDDQSMIVSNGVYLGLIRTDGVNDSFNMTTPVDFKSNSGLFTVYKDAGGNRYNLIGRSGSAGGIGWTANGTISTNFGMVATNGNQANATTGVVKTQQNVISVLWQPDSTAAIYAVNGSAQTFTFAGGSFFENDTPIPLGVIGKDDNATGSLDLQEIIVYSSDKTANREAIETNINNHYSIY